MNNRSNSLIKPLINQPLTLFKLGVFASLMIISQSLSAQALTESTIIHLQQQLEEHKKQLNQLQNQVNDQSGDASGLLVISGYFDVTAHNTDTSDHPFDVGGLELGVQYDQGENFSVSTALVWGDDSSEIAVAVLDYHVNSHLVPTRGSLFGEAGYHLQFGRFDIPFGIDYEYFAAPDRHNVTAPLTTQRIQNDGLNGDGFRVYGSWAQLDYAVYLTNSLFEEEGSSTGFRLGFYPGRDPFRVHNRETQGDFLIGVSWLRDMDSDEEERNTLSAIDVTWQYGMTQIIMEYISLDSIGVIDLPGGGNAGNADEAGYNLRMVLDFDNYLVFMSYGEWKPEYSAVLDEEDDTIVYGIEKLKRATLAISYSYDDFLQIKLEYLSHLNTSTEEPGFEDKSLTFQMVASF